MGSPGIDLVSAMNHCDERRNTPKEEKQRLKEVSKHKKLYQGHKKMKRQQDIQRTLEDLKGVKNTQESNLQRKECTSPRKRMKKEKSSRLGRELPMSLVNSTKKYDDNEQEETEQEIGENENESSIDVHSSNTNEMMRIPEITTEELQTAINKLKKGKSPHNNGIRAEDIKACDDETTEMVRQIFNEIIKRNEFPPEAWKKVTIKEIHKKRDVEDVGNCRTICSLPALYKLFTTVLYSRLCPRLDQKQAEDQAGFRSSYQTTDHLATYRMVDPKCHERRIKMWPATMDFMKAFDSITHTLIWNALKSCGIEHDYISLLKKRYRDQKATVLSDEESDMFEIKKGTTQGDPLSSLLFNTVLQKALEELHSTLAKEKMCGNLLE